MVQYIFYLEPITWENTIFILRITGFFNNTNNWFAQDQAFTQYLMIFLSGIFKKCYYRTNLKTIYKHCGYINTLESKAF